MLDCPLLGSFFFRIVRWTLLLPGLATIREHFWDQRFYIFSHDVTILYLCQFGLFVVRHHVKNPTSQEIVGGGD